MESSKISRIIHHMWLDKKKLDNEGPPSSRGDYQEYCDRLRTLNVEFEYRFWNRRKVRELWEDPRLSRWKNFYYTLRHHIESCDVARYAIMFLLGGIYIDLDFIPVRDFGSLLYFPEETPCISGLLSYPKARRIGLVWEPEEHAQMYGERPFISNSFLMSEPGHPFWSGLLDFIMKRYHRRYNVVKSTGPWILGEYYRSLPEPSNSYFLNTCLFYPVTAEKGNPVTAGCPPNALEEAIAYTEYVKGSGWAYSVASTAAVEASWIVLMAFLLAVALTVLFLSGRNRFGR